MGQKGFSRLSYDVLRASRAFVAFVSAALASTLVVAAARATSLSVARFTRASVENSRPAAAKVVFWPVSAIASRWTAPKSLGWSCCTIVATAGPVTAFVCAIMAKIANSAMQGIAKTLRMSRLLQSVRNRNKMSSSYQLPIHVFSVALGLMASMANTAKWTTVFGVCELLISNQIYENLLSSYPNCQSAIVKGRNIWIIPSLENMSNQFYPHSKMSMKVDKIDILSILSGRISISKSWYNTNMHQHLVVIIPAPKRRKDHS